MSNNFKESIEKMKVVVLDLMRSAANLDNILQSLESGKEEMSDLEMMYYLKTQISYREGFKKFKLIENIEDRENEIWQELIAQFAEES